MKSGDIHVGHNKDKMLVVLYTSKTHGKESRPQKIKISAVTPTGNGHRFFCPFKAVLTFMAAKGSYATNSEPFFTFADKPNQLRTTLRTLLDKLNLDSSLYDVHSFRIGRTSDLHKFGYSIEQIKIMGRWKSNAVYRYLRN